LSFAFSGKPYALISICHYQKDKFSVSGIIVQAIIAFLDDVYKSVSFFSVNSNCCDFAGSAVMRHEKCID
jgi:hypothetical protein